MYYLPEVKALLTKHGIISPQAIAEKLAGQKLNYESFDTYKLAENVPVDASEGAQFIESLLGHELAYIAETDTWYLWTGIIHKPLTSDAAIKQIIDSLAEGYKALADFVGSCQATELETVKVNTGMVEDDREKAIKEIKARYTAVQSKYLDYTRSLWNNAGVRPTQDKLSRVLAKPVDYFGDDRRWFVFENGVYDMEDVQATKTFTRLDHSPSRPVFRSWNLTEEVGADYPALKRYLTISIPDATQSRFFSKALAVACMGAKVSTRTIVSLQGAPNSGKSMTNRIMEKIGPAFYAEPPTGAITGGRNEERDRYSMRQARYSAFTEVTDKLDREFVLKYTGGDLCTSEEKYVANEGWRPQGMIFMASNYGMNIDKSDEATFGRIAPIVFPNSFLKVTPDADHVQDDSLEEKIVQQSAGFLEWMKWSYLTYLDEGLDKSESMEAVKRDERDTADYSVDQYLADRVEQNFWVIDPDAHIRECVGVTQMFKDYILWTEEFNVPRKEQKGRKQFSKDMQKTFRTDDYQTTRFLGIKVSNGVKL